MPQHPLDNPPVRSAITMGLQQFEQRLERLVESAFAKAFRGGVQPVEIGRRMTREMDLRRRLGVHGIIAPNAFTISLAAEDGERFESFADALARELAEAAREHARSEGYAFVGPVEVTLAVDDALDRGRFEVETEMREGPGGITAASVVLPDGNRVLIGADPIVIGRLPECSISLPDPNVSRRHAELRRRGDHVVVIDLASTNGTRVNGANTKEQILADGDEITVGSTTMRFETS
ncbi:MAG: FhaA domain-containing protein [Acidimicrobiales bacterium]|nr:DUF3662 and FHA domain-containing protein [Actinomycetota bacterium]